MKVVNATPHPIRLQNRNGDLYEIASDKEACKALAATPVEVEVDGKLDTIEFVTTQFHPTKEGMEWIEKNHDPNTLVIGSIISAQAFKGLVVSLVPVKGFERVAPDQKRYYDWKFNIFQS